MEVHTRTQAHTQALAHAHLRVQRLEASTTCRLSAALVPALGSLFAPEPRVKLAGNFIIGALIKKL